MWGRFVDLFRRRRLDADLDSQLAHHLDALEAEYRTRGLAPGDARAAARRDMGGLTQVRDAYRDQHGLPVFETIWRNIRFAVRALKRTPGLTATIVLTLALGIGANSAVFSAIDTVLLRPLSFPDADQLVRVMQTQDGARATWIASLRLEDWNRLNTSFAAITGYAVEDSSDTTGDLPVRVRRARVSPRFVQVWGIAPAIGRGFTDADHRLGASSVALISDRYWRNRFGTDPSVVGKSVRLSGRPHVIVGVMPISFLFPERDVDIWSPEVVNNPYTRRQFQTYVGIGRLRPGATLTQARADLARVQTQLAEQYPDTDRAIGTRVEPLKETMIGRARGTLWLLFAAVSVLLLIACTNIAALLLSRTARREHEFAVRYSLGASRGVVLLQLLTEVGVLALAGAAAGVFVSLGVSAAFRVLAPELPRLGEVGLDARMLFYTMALAMLVTLVCGLFPAVRSSRGAATLAGTGRAQVSVRHPLLWFLVGVQVALSVTLLSSAGLLLRSFDKLSRVDPAFDSRHVLAFHVSGSYDEVRDYDRVVQRIHRTLDELTTLPGVAAAATSAWLPGVGGQNPAEFDLVEGRAASEPAMVAEWRNVSPSYFDTLRIPVLAGELCRRKPAGAVRAGSTIDVMVNRSFAGRYLAGRSAVGLHLANKASIYQAGRISGIVGDAREQGIDREPVPTAYFCDSIPSPFPWFLVRTTGQSTSAVGAIRVKLQELEPLRSLYDIAPLEERIGDAYEQNRLRTIVISVFAVTALSLACLGVWGTLSYLVTLRRREIGLRLSLGAPRAGILSHFLGQAVRIAVIACACGLALSAFFARVLSSMLYGVSASDPITLSTVVAIVLGVAVLAALVPAARAALAEPMRILREE
jgi:putative ABC transport system permease protein